jgi:hypothetical protein
MQLMKQDLNKQHNEEEQSLTDIPKSPSFSCFFNVNTFLLHMIYFFMIVHSLAIYNFIYAKIKKKVALY